MDVELMEERAGRAEEVKKRQRAESEVDRLQGELRAEKRRREEDRDGLLGVVKAMMEGAEQGRKRWAEWEKKAKWGWHGEGRWGWSRDGSSSNSSSNDKG